MLGHLVDRSWAMAKNAELQPHSVHSVAIICSCMYLYAPELSAARGERIFLTVSMLSVCGLQSTIFFSFHHGAARGTA